jgi:hypothetical protein
VSPAFTLVVVPAPVDHTGALIDLGSDARARAELHRRIDALPSDALIDCAQKAGEDLRDIPRYLHECVDIVLVSGSQDFVTLRMDERPWIACGGWDTDLPDSYWRLVALAVSGVTDDPLDSGTDRFKTTFDHSLEEISKLLPDFLHDLVNTACNQASVPGDQVRALHGHLKVLFAERSADLQELVRRGHHRARAPSIDFTDVDLTTR